MRERQLQQRHNKPLINLNARVKSNSLLRLVTPLVRELPGSDNGNLPVSLTPFIGRQAEVEAVGQLIGNPAIRLITLYGTAGTGKTRLGLTVAERLKNQFADGVFFVNLAPLNKPEAGLAAIAQALGIQDHSQLPSLRKIQNHLQKRQVLLILDNFEHVADLGAAVSELLQAAPHLKVLVTSRMVLHLYGESVYNVPTLRLPEDSSLESLSQNEAVRLFVQHASMVNSEFKLTEANAMVVATLCAQLEGLPLSIELAAARCNVFTPQNLLDRLAQAASARFEILNGGFANLPSRHQSLGEALDWSYQLLSEPEKQLFRRLGIFVASFSLEAVEALDGGEDATLETLISLLNNSLLRQVEAAPGEELRFAMLETIREYALAKLTEAGELEEARTTHSLYFIEMAATGAEQLKAPDQLNWLKRLAADHPNILSALEYLIESGETEEAYRLSGDIWVVWWRWGLLNRGRQWLLRILALDRSQVEKVLQGKVLDGMAYLALHQSDFRTAKTYFEQSLAIWRETGASKFLGRAMSGLAGTYRILGNYDKALELNYECLALFRELGETVSEADSLANIGWQLMERGNYEPVLPMLQESLANHSGANYLPGVARTKIYLGDYFWRKNDPAQGITYLEESIALLRKVNHRIQLTAGLHRLGLVYLYQGDLTLAGKTLEEAVEIAEEMSKTLDLTYAYSNLGLLRMVQNNLTEAEAQFRKAIGLREEIGQLEGVLWALEGLAVVALKQGRSGEAQELMEEAGLMRQAIDAPVLPHTIKFILPKLINFQTADSLAARNARTKPQPAVRPMAAYMSAPVPDSDQSSYIDSDSVIGLSSREKEVLKLLAEGHSNNQIAKILIISPGTVNNHLSSIYSKLGVNSRTAAVRYAHDYSLI